jgi:hypothetical protein
MAYKIPKDVAESLPPVPCKSQIMAIGQTQPAIRCHLTGYSQWPLPNTRCTLVQNTIHIVKILCIMWCIVWIVGGGSLNF